MTYVYERLVLRCHYLDARRYLREQLPTIAPAALASGALKAKVVIKYTRARDPLRFHEPWIVLWGAPGAPPEFRGELYVRLGEGTGAVLEIAGDYAPPYDAAQNTDIIAGSRHASAVARMLLAQIALSMEERHRSEAARKARMPA